MKKIAICGSMLFYNEMVRLQSQLETVGFTVYIPKSFEEMGLIKYDRYTQEEGKNLKMKHNLIEGYYKKLPKIYVSSESQIKLDAVSFGFRKIGKAFDVLGCKTKSGVAEQPMSIEETLKGAKGRMKDLKKKAGKRKYEYLASIESGITKIFTDHNYFGISICIIENSKGVGKVSITTEMEIPKSMTDLINNPYPDLGILMQEKYGAENKDPYNYLSNGKVSRLELITQTVINTAALFD